jgi:hypothetical protein
MNDNMQHPQLPFLTREMLKFGNKTPMKIRLNVAADIIGSLILQGITRSGLISLEGKTSSDGKLNTTEIGIDDFPIMLSVTDKTKFFNPKQCWVSVEMEMFDQEIVTLCSGFVYLDKGVSFPAITQEDNMPGRGYIVEEVTLNPAAGAEILETVPAGEKWLIHSASVTFVADATVVNRKPHFVFRNDNGNQLEAFGYANVAASETVLLCGAKYGYVPDAEDAGAIPMVLPPDLWMLPAGTITTDTNNMQAGDNYGLMTLIVEKFFGMVRA